MGADLALRGGALLLLLDERLDLAHGRRAHARRAGVVAASRLLRRRGERGGYGQNRQRRRHETKEGRHGMSARSRNECVGFLEEPAGRREALQRRPPPPPGKPRAQTARRGRVARVGGDTTRFPRRASRQTMTSTSVNLATR